jgi:16S rRNA (cytosine1402-N4)-methyltransferase
MTYHRPVLLQESIDALRVKPDGIYVDLTFGGGGHALSIVEKLNDGGLLVAFDQDSDAAINATRISSKSFRFVKSNFRHFDKFLKVEGVSKADGIFADLGVSSHQIDTADRGFSTRFDGPLDMRMDRSSVKTARQVINTYTEEDLHKIFGMYGEIRNARTLAAAIVEARNGKQIKTIEDLKMIFKKLTPKGKDFKYAAQVFQALRIEVNNELDALKEMLTRSANVLKPGGRLVVISYHSLEDRLVKNFIGKGKFSGEVEKDVFGNQLKPFKSVTRKPVVASESEVAENNRARSARMRVAEKI